MTEHLSLTQGLNTELKLDKPLLRRDQERVNISRSTSTLAFTRALSALVAFIGVAFIARWAGAIVLGIFFLFRALVMFLEIPTDFGLRVAIEKRLSEGQAPSRVASTGLAAKLAPVSLAAIPILLLRDQINAYLSGEFAGLLVLALLAQQLSIAMISLLRGELRIEAAAFADLSHTLTWTALGSGAVYLGYGAQAIALSYILGNVVRFSIGVLMQQTGFGLPSIGIARNLVKFAGYSSISVVGGQVHNSLDLLIIGLFAGTQAAGIYEVAWQVGAPVLLVSTALGETIFPQISAWHSSGGLQRVEKLVSLSILPSLFFVIPASFGVVVLAEDILSVVYGTEFVAGALALTIIIWGKIPRAIRSIAGRTLFGINRPRNVAIASVVDIGLNILFNIPLIYYLGITGAAIGTMASMTVGMVVRVHYLNQAMEIRVPTDEILWSLASASLMILIVLGARAFLEPTNVISLFSLIAIGAATYLVVMVWNRKIRERYFTNLLPFLDKSSGET